MIPWLKNILRQSATPPDREAPSPSAHDRRNAAEAFKMQGNEHFIKGELELATARYQQAVEADPGYADAFNNLGATYRQQNRLDEALASYRKAVALNPALAIAHYNLGTILVGRGDCTAAVNAYKQAIVANPDYVEAHHALAVLLNDCAKFDEAIVHFCSAITLNPQLSTAHNDLGSAYLNKCRLTDAIECFQRALSIEPDAAIPRQNLLFALNYCADYSAEALFREHLKFAEIHADIPAAANHPNERDPVRRLRLGYVSPDFRRHSISYFFEPLLINHDPSQFEVFCYSNSQFEDEVTQRLKARAYQWRTIAGMSDENTAEVMLRDKIDILIDLSGHTGGNRLLTFARKPAPVQVTWLGYPNTTGLPTMDYRITDAHAEPEGMSDHLYTERLLRLPDCLWCYRPAVDVPDTSPLPALTRGYLTFGSFNSFNKIDQPTLNLWAELLRALPTARLMMLTVPEGENRLRLTNSFDELGIDAQRLEFHGKLPVADFHRKYFEVDITLDPVFINGGTTTCESLWMGVPVISLVGKRFLSRAGLTILSTAGLADFAVSSPEEYVRLAAKFADDLPLLAEIRAGLRARLKASPLLDAAKFAREMESLYRKIWLDWCKQA